MNKVGHNLPHLHIEDKLPTENTCPHQRLSDEGNQCDKIGKIVNEMIHFICPSQRTKCISGERTKGTNKHIEVTNSQFGSVSCSSESNEVLREENSIDHDSSKLNQRRKIIERKMVQVNDSVTLKTLSKSIIIETFLFVILLPPSLSAVTITSSNIVVDGYSQLTAVEGREARLPACNVYTSGSNGNSLVSHTGNSKTSDGEVATSTVQVVDEEPSLILWYRGESGIPLYTVDARNSSSLLTSTTVASPELDGRAYFDPGHGSSASYFLLNNNNQQMSPSPSGTALATVNSGKAIHPGSNYFTTSLGDPSAGRRGNSPQLSPSPGKSSKSHIESLDSAGAVISTSKSGASLVLKTVFREDEDEYRCRCDFKKSRTLNFLLNLTVIVPPESVKIIDLKTRERVAGMLGPLDEGSSLQLLCESIGGKPLPLISWYKGDQLIHSNNTIVHAPSSKSNNLVVQSHLTIDSVKREDLLIKYSCRSTNTHLIDPIEESFTLDVNLKPLEVTIIAPTRALSSGVRSELVCRTTGSRPPAQITWWKGNHKLEDASVRQTQSPDGNVTLSSLSFLPNHDDDGTAIACRVHNLQMNHPTMEDLIHLTVHYVPRVKIELGAKLDSNSIREGMDVFFECIISANPWVTEVSWYFEGKQLTSNSSSGMIIANQSLVLQKVKRVHRGHYWCSAINNQGKGESHHFFLKVLFSPVCRSGQKVTYGVARNELISVTCDVDADPPSVTFKWHINNSDISSELKSFTSNNTRSVATYTATVGSRSYGKLICWGENSIGRQREPCIYSILPASPPEPVSNCSVKNQSLNQLLVSCSPGDNGGLRQVFFLEVINTATLTLLGNITSIDSPNFTVSNLPAGSKFNLIVYAANAKGRSILTHLSASTLSLPEKQTKIYSQEEPSGLVGLFAEPIIGLIIGGISTGVILLLLLLAGLRVHNSSSSDRASGSSSTGSGGANSGGGCSASSSGLNHQHSNSIGSLIAHHQSPNILSTSTLPRGHSLRSGQSNYHRSSLSQLVVSTNNSTSPILTPGHLKSGTATVATVTSIDGHNNSTTNTILGGPINSNVTLASGALSALGVSGGSNYAQILHHNSVNYLHHQSSLFGSGGGGGGSIGSNSIGGSSSIGGSVGYGTLTRTGHYGGGAGGGASGNNHHHILPHQGSSDHSASSINPSNSGHHLSKSGVEDLDSPSTHSPFHGGIGSTSTEDDSLLSSRGGFTNSPLTTLSSGTVSECPATLLLNRIDFNNCSSNLDKSHYYTLQEEISNGDSIYDLSENNKKQQAMPPDITYAELSLASASNIQMASHMGHHSSPGPLQNIPTSLLLAHHSNGPPPPPPPNLLHHHRPHGHSILNHSPLNQNLTSNFTLLPRQTSSGTYGSNLSGSNVATSNLNSNTNISHLTTPSTFHEQISSSTSSSVHHHHHHHQQSQHHQQQGTSSSSPASSVASSSGHSQVAPNRMLDVTQQQASSGYINSHQLHYQLFHHPIMTTIATASSSSSSVTAPEEYAMLNLSSGEIASSVAADATSSSSSSSLTQQQQHGSITTIGSNGPVTLTNTNGSKSFAYTSNTVLCPISSSTTVTAPSNSNNTTSTIDSGH